MIAYRVKGTKEIIAWLDDEHADMAIPENVEIDGESVEVERVDLPGVKMMGFNVRMASDGEKTHGKAWVEAKEKEQPGGVHGHVYLEDDKRIKVEKERKPKREETEGV